MLEAGMLEAIDALDVRALLPRVTELLAIQDMSDRRVPTHLLQGSADEVHSKLAEASVFSQPGSDTKTSPLVVYKTALDGQASKVHLMAFVHGSTGPVVRKRLAGSLVGGGFEVQEALDDHPGMRIWELLREIRRREGAMRRRFDEFCILDGVDMDLQDERVFASFAEAAREVLPSDEMVHGAHEVDLAQLGHDETRPGFFPTLATGVQTPAFVGSELHCDPKWPVPPVDANVNTVHMDGLTPQTIPGAIPACLSATDGGLAGGKFAAAHPGISCPFGNIAGTFSAEGLQPQMACLPMSRILWSGSVVTYAMPADTNWAKAVEALGEAAAKTVATSVFLGRTYRRFTLEDFRANPQLVRVVQQEGDLVIFREETLSQSLSVGTSVSESVNFTRRDTSASEAYETYKWLADGARSGTAELDIKVREERRVARKLNRQYFRLL